MSYRRNLSIVGFLITLALPLVLKAEISALETIEASIEEVSQYQTLDGQIEAVNKSTVSAQTGGVISKLNYDIGDYVEKGKLIARISSATQKSGLQQAQASVNEAKASISRSDAAIVQANAATREATANYSVARAEFSRVQGLYKKRILTKSDYDKAEAAMKSTLARVSAAKASLNAAKAGKVAAKSGLSSARAGFAKAGEQLGYTEVFAPYSGIVTERLVELGELVSAGKPIMTGISLKELRVVADIPQRMIHGVRKYRSALVYVDSLESSTFGRSTSVGIPTTNLTFFPYADSSTNAFKVRASLGSAVEGLFPGVFVKISFEVGKQKNLVIPQEAIAYRSEVTGVYVVNEDGIPFLRQVRLGRITNNGEIAVLAGLDAGEKVALDPTHATVLLKQKRLELNQLQQSATSHE